MMLEKFYPYEYADSVFAIDYKKLYDMGYRGIIFDLDNTLVHHGDDSTPEVDALFRRLNKLGFRTALLTDNEQSRVERFIRNIETEYVCDADKPSPKGYNKAIARLGLKKEQIIYIGDQIFTDIVGANRVELANILVKFIRLKDEEWIGKRRYLEYLILSFYKRDPRYRSRLGDIKVKRSALKV
jgi:HAD superfamily phosphatase (TIGR01668 family)